MASNLNDPYRDVMDAMAREYPPATPKPCRECPWRRNALPGYLGPYTAEKWLEIAHGESAIACHLTIPEEGGWGEQTRQCGGSARFRANVCKSPRNPTIADEPEDPARVFETNEEFLAHHRGRRDGA